MPDERLLTRPFVLVSLANLAQGLTFNLFLHFPGYLQQLGATEVQIGVLFGITAVASIAVRPWVGRTMDTRGRRPVILAAAVLNLAVLLLYLTVTGLGVWVYVVRVIHGFAEALLFTSLFTYGADQVPASRRTEGLALFGVSGLLPLSLGGVIGDVVLALDGFDALFLTAAGFAVLALLLSLPLRDVEVGEATPEAGRRGFRGPLTQPDLLPLWWLATVFSVALTGYFTFMKTFVAEVGFGSVGLFFSAYAFTAIALRLGAAWLPERVGPKRVLYPALAAMAAGFLVLAGAESIWGIAVSGVLCGAGHGYTFPIVFSFVVTRARAAERGTAIAIFTSLFDLGVLVGGPLLGAVIRLGSYQLMFRIAGGMIVAGAIVFALWDGPGDRSPTRLVWRRPRWSQRVP